MIDSLTAFGESLAAEEASPNTIDRYILDLQSFAQWFHTTKSEEIALQGNHAYRRAHHHATLRNPTPHCATELGNRNEIG